MSDPRPPSVTAAEMRELERRAFEDHGIGPLALMEEAGKRVAEAALLLAASALGRKAEGLRILVLCGRGSNGGDGLVAARLLRERGAAVRVVLVAPRAGGHYGPETAASLANLRAGGLEPETFSEGDALPAGAVAGSDLVVDAILGTGSAGAPRGAVLALISALKDCDRPVLAVDLPSGLDADTGETPGAAVRATVTLALGVAKRGALAAAAAPYVGQLQLADIGLPPAA